MSLAARATTLDMGTIKLMHDLKSPLTALRVLLSRSGLAAAEDGLLKATVSQLEKLLSSCIGEHSAGENLLRSSEIFNLCQHLTSEASLVSHGNVVLNWNVPELSICAAGLTLYRLLANLLHNAVEAADAHNGEVELRATVEDSRLVFQIMNNVGETPSVSRKAKRHNWGIGLIIVREILARLGGDMELTKSENRACVRVSLPAC